MKAIVAEIDKKQMIVITDKGDFIKVKRQMSAAIGDEIELKPQRTYLAYKGLARAAACFIACIFLSTGVYAYYTPYSYVSVDINPSISLSLNRFERVLSVNPLTEDAVGIINNTKNLKNQDIDRALSEIIKSASGEGYIDQETENQIMVVVSTKNPKQEKELEDKVTAAAAKELLKVNKNYGVTVEKTSVESYKTALSNKTSPGKEILGDKLREVIPEIKDEEVKNMSVKEAVKLIKEGREAAKKEEKDKKDKGKDKEENPQRVKDKNGHEAKGASKTEEKDKGNNKNGEKKNPEAAASKKNDEDKRENNKKIEAEEKKKEKEKEKVEKDKDNNKNNKKKDKTDNDKPGGEKNKNEVKDKEKNNDNPEKKGTGNKKGQGR